MHEHVSGKITLFLHAYERFVFLVGAMWGAFDCLWHVTCPPRSYICTAATVVLQSHSAEREREGLFLHSPLRQHARYPALPHNFSFGISALSFHDEHAPVDPSQETGPLSNPRVCAQEDGLAPGEGCGVRRETKGYTTLRIYRFPSSRCAPQTVRSA